VPVVLTYSARLRRRFWSCQTGAAGSNSVYPLEEAGSLSVPCGAVEDSVVHRLGGGVAAWAGGGEVRVLPGWVGGQVALAGPHLMESAGNELSKTHKGVGFGGGLVRVVGGGREGEVPIPQEGEVGLLLELGIGGFNRRERGSVSVRWRPIGGRRVTPSNTGAAPATRAVSVECL
jgi:hypothetical protein